MRYLRSSRYCWIRAVNSLESMGFSAQEERLAFAKSMEISPTVTGKRVQYFWAGADKWVDVLGAYEISLCLFSQ